MSVIHNSFKTAQDVLSNRCCGDVCGGFNTRIYGEELDNRYASQGRRSGYYKAEDMIRDGRIFYVHSFHRTHSKCKGHAFLYGGFWVCNSCGGKGVDMPWWKIRVFKDGHVWCCVGEGFKDQQTSSNYGCGNTRQEAINAYGDKMEDV